MVKDTQNPLCEKWPKTAVWEMWNHNEGDFRRG